MKPSMTKALSSVASVVIAVFVLVFAMAAETSANEASHMTAFDVPGNPLHIVVETTGKLWYTLPEENAIGSLTVTSSDSSATATYQVPTANSQPYDLAFDADRNLIWFTELEGNRIGRLNIATGAIQEYTIPTPNSSPTGIALDDDGIVWFAQRAGNQLASFDPDTQSFAEYPYPTAAIGAEDVAVQPGNCASGEGCVWSTGANADMLVGLTLESKTFIQRDTVDLATGETLAEPWNATVDAQGKLWITTRDGNAVGLDNVGTVGYWRWFRLHNSNSAPTGIATSRRDNLQYVWFAESDSGRVGQLVLRSNGARVALRSHALPASDGTPWDVTVDAEGNVWITDKNNASVVRWRSPYFHFLYLPTTLNQIN